MWKYILKRLLWLIPIILGVTLLVFALMSLKPGDPGRVYLGLNATQEAVDAYNESLGLNDPFFVRYFNYVKGLIKLDFGKSWVGGESVNDRIMSALPQTLKVCVYALIVAFITGLPIGVLSAVKQYSLADRVLTVIAMILACIPVFWLCNMAAMFFTLKLHWLPATGLDTWKAYIMPVVGTAANTIGLTVRMARSSMLDEMRKDYIRTARAKGAKESSVIFKHALRNSLISVTTTLGVNFSILMGGTVFVENVYAIQGLGTCIVRSISNNDVPMLSGCVIILATFSVIVNLLVDLLYAYLDPRLRAKYAGKKKMVKAAKKEVLSDEN
ncbi:MAG: ABC transporter permease [Oscillospiraceae bacterium]|nr:ABC transporter permease [Oscillospiraceae bacterium]